MAVQLAERVFGVPKAIARLDDPAREAAYRALAVDFVPTARLVARVLVERVHEPEFAYHLEFPDGDVQVVEMVLGAGAAGLTVAGLEVEGQLRVAAVQREGMVLIPGLGRPSPAGRPGGGGGAPRGGRPGCGGTWRSRVGASREDHHHRGGQDRPPPGPGAGRRRPRRHRGRERRRGWRAASPSRWTPWCWRATAPA